MASTDTAAGPQEARAEDPKPARKNGPWPSLLRHLLLALGAYVPLLLTAPGRVAADTKIYLYLDPGRLLARAPSMWDPNVGLGTVTHQNIGYLFPMGPWFWLLEQLGVPDWVAQRLWVATIMLAAGAGVLFLLRSLGGGFPDAGEPAGWPVRLAGGGALAGAALYMLSPYILNYGARTSVLLLPWAALPWLLGLTQRALRSGSWRHPAAFAIVVTLVGGVNATALLLAGIGPLLWLPFAVWVHREVTLRRALAAAGRIGALTLGCSLWWIAGLAVQGGYGIDVLAYTETVKTVASTSPSSEVLRSLGLWFFYGGDKLGPWIEPGQGYVQHLWLIATGFAITGLAIVAAVSTRWRYRASFVALVVVGTAAAVGAFPYDSPSPLGGLFKAFATSSSAGLAMRSTPRAVPLLVLGLAVLLAAGLAALARARPRLATAASALVLVLAVVGLPPLWTGDFIGGNLQSPEEVPAYWREAAAYLDIQGDGTRVLEIPGSDFASYRWGTTLDPITPGLMDRPYVARELIPYGSEPSADLLIALDRRLQDGLLDPAVLAPIARLMGVGDIVLRSDLQYERYRTARPRATWALLDPTPDGLEAPVSFGARRPNLTVGGVLNDEVELATPPGTPDPPPVAVFGVEDPLPIVRATSADQPLLLAGDGDGVVGAAAAGLLDGSVPLFYSAALADDPDLFERLIEAGADLVLSDSNRRQSQQWNTVWENFGYTEQAGATPLDDDLYDNRLPLFPDAGDESYTTVEYRGVRSVAASGYGNPVTYIPESRAANALDGDDETAWRVGDFSPVRGERLVVVLEEPVTTDRIEVVQPLTGTPNRWVTRVGVVLDGEDIGTFSLDETSREAAGQALDIGRRSFSRLELVVREDNVGPRRRYNGLSPVGFAEVRVADVRADEVVRLPSDLLDMVGAGSGDHDLTVLLERQRSNPAELGRRDEEQSIVRSFSIPTARRFTLEGDARISAYLPETEIDRLLGISPADDDGITVQSSSYLRGLLSARGFSAVDGDPATSWQTAFGETAQIGAWIDVQLPGPVTIDHLDLVLVADGQHSVPTRLRIEAGGQTRTIEVPPVSDEEERGATASVSVGFDPLTTADLRVTVEDVRAVRSTEYYSEQPIVRPIGVAELGIPGVSLSPPARLPERCQRDVLEVDGRPVGVRITGSVEDAAARSALAVELCDDDDLALEEGEHLLRATKGKEMGIDLDRLVLRSTAGGEEEVSPPPALELVDAGRTSFDLRVRDATEPFWLVLGQSLNAGWQAEVDGGPSLGEATLVDGFANGWYVEPGGEDDLRLSLEWEPQRRVWAALALSAASFTLCLAVAVVGWRRRPASVSPACQAPDAWPVLPAFSSPLSFPLAAGRRLSPVHAVVVALGCGIASALLVSPLVGAVVLAAVALALRFPRRGRAVLTVGAASSFALAAGYVLARQAWKGGPPPDFTWPTYFTTAHVLAWTAVLLLAADVVVELVRHPPKRWKETP